MRGESIERAVLKVRGGGRDLSVFRQGIGDQGAEILSRALRTSGAVEWIDLTGNGISSAGATHLADAIDGKVRAARRRVRARVRVPAPGG
jgi:hypothetical protein